LSIVNRYRKCPDENLTSIIPDSQLLIARLGLVHLEDQLCVMGKQKRQKKQIGNVLVWRAYMDLRLIAYNACQLMHDNQVENSSIKLFAQSKFKLRLTTRSMVAG